MKCTYCGLPLSPNHTPMVCPRCHATTQAGSRSGHAQMPPFNPQSLGGREGQEWNNGSSYNQLSASPVAQLPFSHQGQPGPSSSTPTPGALAAPFATPQPMPVPYDAFTALNTNTTLPPHTPGIIYTPTERPRSPHHSNLGFFVAAFFVISGGIMLILVYILGLGLPPTSATTSLVGTPNVTKSIFPSSTTTAHKPPAGPTPATNAFPGQQFIANPQMASAINVSTASPTQPTTTFHVNQRIYVTFTISPNGKSGAVCLYWFLNNHSVTQYPFAVPSTARAAYSFAIYGGKGAAYVEIYWASSISCSDRMLAQHVNFTVIA